VGGVDCLDELLLGGEICPHKHVEVRGAALDLRHDDLLLLSSYTCSRMTSPTVLPFSQVLHAQ
jgi:hypothetical protein